MNNYEITIKSSIGVQIFFATGRNSAEGFRNLKSCKGIKVQKASFKKVGFINMN